MNSTPLWGRYAELRPEALARIRALVPVAYLPWGGLDWHGPHLPLGLNGMIAEAITERAVKRTGGVLLPVTDWPAASFPHQASLTISFSILRTMLDAILDGLAHSGWRIAVLISGYYGPAYDLMCMDAAQAAITRHGLLTLAVPTLALVDEEMLDHGGLWESSVLLALRPELVALQALGVGPLHPAESGVVGRDPRDTASISLGLSALNLAVGRVVAAVADLIERNNPAPLNALYEQRRQHYQAFVARYGNDPDVATAAWWQDLTRSE